MEQRLAEVVARDARIAYALVFGSSARGAAHARSDLDVAIGLTRGARFGHRDLGGLAAGLEAAAGRPVDLVVLDEAPAPLAYRVFRDGRAFFVRDRAVLVERKTRAILEYLDFKPVEDLCARGALRAAAHGR